MGRMRKNTYLTSEQIHAEWRKWKQSGVIGEELGRQMMLFAEHFLMGPRFNRYPKWVKDEMASAIYEKIERNLKNLTEERKDGFFNYWSCCASSACIDYLNDYYKHINLRRRLLLEELERQQAESPTTQNRQNIAFLKGLIAQFDNNMEDKEDVH